MTTNTVKHTPDAPHTIPDHVAARAARLINEAEDMRQQAADDLKQIYADLREELRGMGWVGSVVSAEVAALKGAIAEIRLDSEKKAKREEKGERIDDYVSMLSRARARERRSYAEQKGRGDAVGNSDAISFDPKTGEITDNQESGPSSGQVRAISPSGAGTPGEVGTATVETATDEISTQDDVGATASSTNSNSSDPLRSDKAETLPSSQEVSATNSALVAQRTEQGASTSSAAGSNPAECSTDEDFTPPAFLSRESKPLRPLCQNPDNCSGYGAKTCHACLKSAGVSYGASA